MFSVDDLDVNFDEEFEDEGCANDSTLLHVAQKFTAAENFRKDTFRTPSRAITTAPILTSTPNVTEASSLTPTRKGSFEHPSLTVKSVPLASSNKQCVIRRFPGPAGLLPDKPPPSFDDHSLSSHKLDEEPKEKKTETILCSQASENAFSEPPFKRLKKDFNIDVRDSPLADFTVEWVRKKAVAKGLKGRKIPFLAVVLQSVDCSSADPVLSLRDPTGELSGTLHREVWREMGEQLRPGAAIVLKQVGVFSTGASRRKVLLNITMNNIVTVYSPSDEGEVIVNPVHPTTTADLVKSIADWHARPQNSPVPDAISSPKSCQSLFQSVTSITPSLPGKGWPKLVNSLEVNQPLRAVRKPHQTDRVNGNFDLVLDESDFAEVENAIKCQAVPVADKQPVSEHQKNSISNNFDLLFDGDVQFEDAIVSQIEDLNKNHSVNEQNGPLNRPDLRTCAKFVPKCLTTAHSAKTDQFRTPEVPRRHSSTRFEICSQTTLSDAESSQIDEVLSGVDLDDF